MATDAEFMALVGTVTLDTGWHRKPVHGVNIMELVALVQGEPWNENWRLQPWCVSRIFRAFVLALGESIEGHLLLPFLPRLVGTPATPVIERRRAEFLAWKAVTAFAPFVLDAHSQWRLAAAARAYRMPETPEEWVAAAAFCRAANRAIGEHDNGRVSRQAISHPLPQSALPAEVALSAVVIVNHEDVGIRGSAGGNAADAASMIAAAHAADNVHVVEGAHTGAAAAAGRSIGPAAYEYASREGRGGGPRWNVIATGLAVLDEALKIGEPGTGFTAPASVIAGRLRQLKPSFLRQAWRDFDNLFRPWP